MMIYNNVYIFAENYENKWKEGKPVIQYTGEVYTAKNNPELLSNTSKFLTEKEYDDRHDLVLSCSCSFPQYSGLQKVN